ncbi:hypothetical protein [Aquibium microcysteis]|uniref:hypothetical protein n=1 Tax=Aquibium microcysteis TaxID=675281 RepID=UPI00165D1927|nr:hypothetical protein [Aquibium microcysteis]
MKRLILLGILGTALAGCTTTEEANKAIKSRWIGQPSDSFFAQYGPPVRSFPLNNGGIVYTWRGGETTQVIPAEYRTIQPATPLASSSSTVTTVTRPDPGTTVTETRTTNLNLGLQAQPQHVLVRPERIEQLFCEAQITVDRSGVIGNIEASRDTTGAGFSLSRCAEVFRVQ